MAQETHTHTTHTAKLRKKGPTIPTTQQRKIKRASCNRDECPKKQESNHTYIDH